jgi:hypothetical protein
VDDKLWMLGAKGLANGLEIREIELRASQADDTLSLRELCG